MHCYKLKHVTANYNDANSSCAKDNTHLFRTTSRRFVITFVRKVLWKLKKLPQFLVDLRCVQKDCFQSDGRHFSKRSFRVKDRSNKSDIQCIVLQPPKYIKGKFIPCDTKFDNLICLSKPHSILASLAKVDKCIILKQEKRLPEKNLAYLKATQIALAKTKRVFKTGTVLSFSIKLSTAWPHALNLIRGRNIIFHMAWYSSYIVTNSQIGGWGTQVGYGTPAFKPGDIVTIKYLYYQELNGRHSYNVTMQNQKGNTLKFKFDARDQPLSDSGADYVYIGSGNIVLKIVEPFKVCKEMTK